MTRRKSGQSFATAAERAAAQDAFLASFATQANVTVAAAVAGVSRQSVYRWRRAARFRERWLEAERQADDVIDREIHRRAIEGVEKPVHYKGRRVDTVREYSDTLLIFLAKARMPDKYRERVEVDITAYVRQLAENAGVDPDEAVREAQRIVKGL